jgi:hypothetical protein
VRQVDHVHHAEHQRQPGGEQKQHQAELQAVQRLLDEQDAAHARPMARAARGAAGRPMQVRRAVDIAAAVLSPSSCNPGHRRRRGSSGSVR